MANAFNLTAQINLRGPNNLKPIIAQIKRELGTVSANVQVKIDPKSAKSIDNITARLRIMNSVLIETRNHTQAVNQALGSMSSGFASLKSSSSGAASGMNQALQTMKQTASTVQVARTEMEEFGKQSYLAVKRFAAFSFVTTAIFAVTNAITSGLQAFIVFDKELVKLQQVTGKGAIGLKDLESEITRLSTTLGVSSESLMTVASTLAQAGLNANDTRVALEALAKTELAPSFDSLTDTTEGAIAALKQFELQTSDLEAALGSINAVAAAFAVESKDIIAAIQRTGGVFATASKGVSEGKDALNEFIAVFTSVRQTTRESAETIATGLRTIFTRIQRARTIDQLKEFGVELTDLEGKFVGPYEAIKRLSSVLGELDPRDLRFSQIVEELGGFRQIGKVIPLIQQFSIAQEALKIAQKGQGSLAEAAATAQKSLANQIAKVREQFLALVRDVGKSTVFQGLFKIVTSLASSLISLASAFKPILPILGILGAVKGASALTQFAGGFFGSMNKGGAKNGGDVSGSATGSTKEKEKSDATNKATEAIKANTAALNQLTSAVQSLSNKIGSAGGPTTLNSGGKVAAFARGGLVPGSGNGDTVSAALTPGEFVIRKKAVESIGASNLHRMNKYASGGKVKRFARGGINEAPLVDDILQTSGAVLPKPSNIEKLIQAGGGAVDIDRTLIRTIGDKAYGKASTSGAKKTVLDRFFDDEAARLQDIKSAPITGFGKALQKAIQSGQLKGNKVSIVSKSRRAKGVPEYLSQLFGIPVQNMAFTQGEAKQPFMDSLRSKGPRINRVKQFSLGGLAQKFAGGGMIQDIKDNSGQLRLGAAILEQGGLTSGDGKLTTKGLFSNVDSTNVWKKGTTQSVFDAKTTLKFQESYQGLSENTNKIFQESIDRNLMQGINGATIEIASKLGLPTARTSEENSRVFLNGINTGARGSLFEDVLSTLSNANASLITAKKPGDPFDFPFFDNKILGGEGEYTSLPYKWVDAKASFDTAKRESGLTGKAETQLTKELEAGIASGEFIKAQTAEQIKKIGVSSGIVVRSGELAKGKIKQLVKEGKIKNVGTQKYEVLSPLEEADMAQSASGGFVQRFAFGGEVEENNFEKIRKQIMDKYPEINFRITKRKRGFGYNILGGLNTESDTVRGKYGGFEQASNLEQLVKRSDQMANSLLYEYGPNIDPSILKKLQKKKFASGGPVDLYHGSNTGINNSVLNSFKEKGALSNIATGYGQGAGFYMYTEKEKAARQAKMRVSGGGFGTVVSGDTSGKPMVLSFNEQLSPENYDLDYELQKRLVTEWIYDNFDKLKEQLSLQKNPSVSLLSKIIKNPEAGIMSSGIRVQEGDKTLESEDGQQFTVKGGARKTIYSGSEGDIREGELLGRLMSDIQSGNPELVRAFESRLFDTPRGLALKYVGSSPLRPSNIETFAEGGQAGVSSQDTVPALLTPGEFVINKKAAKSIGYAQLHRMNKADKIQGFNKGGAVGNIQRFVAGGAVEADELKFFSFKAREAGESLNIFRKNLASKVAKETTSIQENQQQQKEALKYSAIGQRGEFKGLDLTLDEDLKKIQPVLNSFAERLQAIDPSINAKQAQDAALKLAEGLTNTTDSVDDIIKSSTSLTNIFDKTYSAGDAAKLALSKVAKEAGFTADILKNNLGNELKKQTFIQSEVGQKFGILSEKMPGLLESFSNTKIGKGTIKTADILSGQGLAKGLEKQLGESGKFIGDKINALGGPMVVLGGALSMAADQITRNMNITDPGTAGAIGAVGGAGSGLASGALLGAQVAGPVGAMIGGIGGAIIGGIKGYFDAFNTKLLENNLKALDKSAGELELALKKLNIASNDATAAEVAKAAIGDQAAVKSIAQQAQLPSGPSAARGWLDFLRQEPTGLVSSVTGAGQEGEARQALFANVERALGAFEKLGERNLAQSPSNQIRDVLNEANAAEATGGKEAKREVLARANQTYQMMVRPESMDGGGLGSDEAFLAMGVQQSRQRGQDPAKLLLEEGGRQKLIDSGKALAEVEAEASFKQRLLAESIRETSIQAENLIDIYRRVTANLERFGNELNNIKNQVMDAASAVGGRAATGPVDRTNEQVLSNVSAYSQEQVNVVAEQVSGLSGDEQLGNQVKAAKILQDELPKILKTTQGQNVEDVTDQLKKVFDVAKIEVPPDLFTSIEDSLREKLGGRKAASMSDIAGESDVLEIAAKVEAEALKVASAYLKQFNDALDLATNFAKDYASALDEADQMYTKAANIRLEADLKLAEALGNTTSLAQQNAPFENEVKRLSGGSTDPNQIFALKQAAVVERDKAKGNLKENEDALSRDPANAKLQEEYKQSITSLEQQNIKINNANKALELLASDGSAAANALSKIQEQQRKVEGFGNFLEKVATADFDQLVQMRRESAALIVAQNSGPEFMQNTENRQMAFAGLNAQRELYSPEEFRGKKADLLTKFYQSQGFEGQDTVPSLGGMTLDDAMERIRGGVSEDDPNVKAYREATARQAEAADKLGDTAKAVAEEFNKGLMDVMAKIATLPDAMKQARNDAKPEPVPVPEELKQKQQLVLSPEALALLNEGIKVNTLGLDPKITGQLDTTMQNLQAAIIALTIAITTLGLAFAAYQAGGVGNLVSDIAGAVGGRRRKGFGGGNAPRAGSRKARDAQDYAGRERKTDQDIRKQRQRIEERQKQRDEAASKPKPKTPVDASPAKKPLPRRAPGTPPTTPQKPLPRRGAGDSIPSTPTPSPLNPVPKPSVGKQAAAITGQVLDKAVDAVSVIDEVVGVATSATNIATGQGTAQDVIYGASDAAELAGRGGGIVNMLKGIPGVGTAIEAVGSAGGAVASRLGLGGAGGALGAAGSAVGIGKPVLGATGGFGAGLGNFAALNTAISLLTNSIEFMSDPEAYKERKQAQSNAGLERAQQRTGSGELALDSLGGALEGFTDPIGKIVEGGFVVKDLAKDVSAANQAQAKTERMGVSAQKQVAETRKGGAIATLGFDEQRRVMEEAQIKSELAVAERVQTTGGSLGDVAKIYDTTEEGLGGGSLQDFIAKKQSQLQTLPQDRIDSREKSKDGTWDWSSNMDPTGFADAVSQEIAYRLSQIQLPPLPVKPEVKPEDATKLNTSKTPTTPEGQVAEQKTQTETSKAASDKRDTPAEVKSTVAAVAKTEGVVEPESCECKVLKEILAVLKSTSINRQTTPTTSTPVQAVIPAPIPPGATSVSLAQEPTTPISEAQAVSVAQTPKEVTSKEQKISSQTFVEGEDYVTRAEKEYAPTAERKAFVIKELKDARQRQRIGQKLPTDDGVISASSVELKNISQAEKTKAREQYLLKQNPRTRARLMTKAEKESGLAEKLADQPQLKEEPKARNPRQEAYQSEKQSRRQAFLARFRPEVREGMMTKEEKAARDKAQTQATTIRSATSIRSAAQQGNQSHTTPTSEQFDSIRQALASPPGGESKTQPAHPVGEIRKTAPPGPTAIGGTTTQPTGIPVQPAHPVGEIRKTAPVSSNLPKPMAPANGPTGLPSGGPTGDGGFQIQLDPNAQSFIDNLQKTFDSFNTYIDKLSTVAATIPSKIELTGNYVLDVQISGAAAFEALDSRMKELAVSLVEPKLQQLRDEVSAATAGQVKSSSSLGKK